MDVSSLNLALPAAGDAVPEWVQLMPAGTFRGKTGDQTYHLKNTDTVIANSATDGVLKLPFDENHSTQRAHLSGSPSPARGWIVELQDRGAAGLWGKVDWNEDGQALMTKKSYRFVSPVFGYDAAGNVTRVISAALTNDPNLDLTALHTKPGVTMERKAICTALGLAATVDDATLNAALAAAAAAQARVTELTAEMTALKAGTVPATEVVTLQTRLQTLEAERATERATAFVDAAIKAGKPIAPVRMQFIAQHCADPAATEALLNGMISINAGGTMPRKTGAPASEGQAEMTAQQMAICTKMGLDPKKYAEHIKAAATSEGSAA